MTIRLEIMIDQRRAIYHKSLKSYEYIKSTILFTMRVLNKIKLIIVTY